MGAVVGPDCVYVVARPVGRKMPMAWVRCNAYGNPRDAEREARRRNGCELTHGSDWTVVVYVRARAGEVRE